MSLSIDPAILDTEYGRCFKWRFNCLCDAGVPYAQAAVLADHTEVDLHQAVEMAKKNCKPELLLEILL